MSTHSAEFIMHVAREREGRDSNRVVLLVGLRSDRALRLDFDCQL